MTMLCQHFRTAKGKKSRSNAGHTVHTLFTCEGTMTTSGGFARRVRLGREEKTKWTIRVTAKKAAIPAYHANLSNVAPLLGLCPVCVGVRVCVRVRVG